MTTSKCDLLFDALQRAGHGQASTYGLSAQKRPLRIWSSDENASGGILMYGYAHPDEPHFSQFLAGLLHSVQDGKDLPAWLPRPVRIILNPDPDAVMGNTWLDKVSLSHQSVWQGSWRSVLSGEELDYSFEGGWPKCETRAFATLIENTQPQWIVSGHGSAVSGVYTYSNKDISQSSFAEYTRKEKLPRHMGLQEDEGTISRDKDCLKEVSLQQIYLRHGLEYSGCLSLSQWCEKHYPTISILSPETPLWTHNGFEHASSKPDYQRSIRLMNRWRLRLQSLQTIRGSTLRQRQWNAMRPWIIENMVKREQTTITTSQEAWDVCTRWVWETGWLCGQDFQAFSNDAILLLMQQIADELPALRVITDSERQESILLRIKLWIGN